MKLTNRLGLPQAIVNALSHDEYDRGPADISVTGLSSPPRQQALANAHGSELEEDASDLIYALLGKAVHHILEVGGGADPTTITEERYFMTVPGPLGNWVVSGQMDSIDLEPLEIAPFVGIDDWKTAKVAEMVYGVKAEREEQLNVYKVLLEAQRQADGMQRFHVGRLRDYFMLRDWSKIQAARVPTAQPTLTGTQPESTYPESQMVRHDVRIWSADEAREFILERVALHQQAQDAYRTATLATQPVNDLGLVPQSVLPECTDDERWARKPSFAAVKTGATHASAVRATREEAEQYAQEHTAGFDYVTEQRGDKVAVKRADNTGRAKLFDTTAEAEAWMASKAETYKVVERPAESIRCEFYCNVSAICEQWRAIREERANG